MPAESGDIRTPDMQVLLFLTPFHGLHAGILIGEDANQWLQADINADPTTRLEAATLYRDTSGWFTRVHSTQSVKSAGEAQGPDAEGQGCAGEQPRDRIMEVEDAGLEGGQEGVAQEPAGGFKQERERDEAQQTEADPVRVKEEEEAEESEPQGSQESLSIAIFGEEIAAERVVKHDDHPADPQLRQAQAGSVTDLYPGSASAQDQPISGRPAQDDTKESLLQQDGVYQPSSNGVVDHIPDNSVPANQQLPAVKTFTVLCRENGMLEIYSLPDMQLLFSYSNPIEGPPLLTPGGSSPPQPEEGAAKLRVVEARMESFGPKDASGDFFFPFC